MSNKTGTNNISEGLLIMFQDIAVVGKAVMMFARKQY